MKIPLSSFLPWLAYSAALLMGSAQAITAAGTTIPNQATAVYTLPNTNTPTQSLTNTVTASVTGVCGIAITAEGAGSAAILPGEYGTFGFTISNIGNDSSNAALVVSAAGASDIKIYADSNKNGKVDEGEPEITQATLAAGASQKVLVVAKTPISASVGQYAVSLSSVCDGKPVSATTPINVTALPQLSVVKKFDKEFIKPGDTTTVTITASNSGGESREVTITDALEAMAAMGLVFDGNLQATAGAVEYSTDAGSSWQATPPSELAKVTNLRVRVPSMATEANVSLSFRMKALESADGRNFINIANAVSSGSSAQGSAAIQVHYTPAVFIGPKGNPTAPDGTPADAQTTPFGVIGQKMCFDHTVQNTGDVADSFTFTVTFPQGQANATIVDANGQPLTQPINLAPNESASVKVCYDLTTSGSLDALVTVTGKRGTSNPTHDLINIIEKGLPELKKASNASSALATGNVVTYSLSAHNPYSWPMNDVVIQDPLPAHTEFVSADNGGVNSGNVVTWKFGTLAPGETRVLTVSAKVTPEAKDGEQITNTFTLHSKEITPPIPSNPVENVVWNALIRIDKAVSNPEATPGDALTYTLVIHNDSPQATLRDAVVTDIPAPGLEYIPGSATLEGKPLADPTMNGGMNWSIGDLAPSKDVKITYQMRVTPMVSGDLVNTVQVVGLAGNANTSIRKIASNRATALTRPRLKNLSSLNDIVGTVFVDRNRNGIFDKGLDTPVERARVLLAGGRLALTDKEGRYHFANVAMGTQALRLDPITTSYTPLNTPQTQGLSGTQTTFVRGLTSVDFPLAPVGGDITAIRHTTLTIGDLHLDKSVYHTDQGYVVSIKLSSTKPLEQFDMDDPLPMGATLQEGRNTFKGTLPAGETVLNYRFTFAGGDEAAVTDPNVVWRY